MTQVRNKEAKLEARYREEVVGGLSPLGKALRFQTRMLGKMVGLQIYFSLVDS